MKKLLTLLTLVLCLNGKAQTCPILTAPLVGNSWFEHTIDQLEINNVYSPYSPLNNDGTYLSVTTPFWTLYAGMPNTLYAAVGQGQNPEIFACWIDYNQNGYYETTENVFGQGIGLAGGYNDLFYNYVLNNIPASVKTGLYNIRFRVSYTDIQTSACNYTGNGETEDYVINIIQPGTALNFDGINDYCQKAAVANITNKLTLESRISLTDTLSTGQMIVYNGDINNNGVGLYIPPHDSSIVIYYGGIGQFNTGYKLTRGVLTSISAVINDSVLSCYINGVNTYSVNTGGIPNSPSGNFTIGANTIGTNNFYGSIDEVRVWKRPLCASEISSHTLCQLTGKDPGLITYYRFNEGVASDSNLTVTTLADSSVYALNSTLYNFALIDSTSNWIYAPGSLSTTCSYYAGSFTLSATSNYICPGDSSVLSVIGATTYSWSTGATSSSIIVTPTVVTTYSVNAVGLNGCGGMQSKIIYIAPRNVSINPSTASICIGNNSSITANGVVECNWIPINDTNLAITVNPTVTTTYSVTGITSNGCLTDTASITVFVNPLPLINAYALSPSICKNSNDTLIFSGGRNYTLNPLTGYISTTSTGIVVSPSVTTNYTITGTDSNFCSNSYVMSVTVNPNPLSNVIIAQTACSLCNGTATVTTSGGTLPYQYVWNSVSTYNAEVSNLCAGTYTCIVKDTNSCKDTIQAVINSSSTLGLSASYTLTANVTPHVWDVYPSVSGGTMPYSYLWFWGDGTTDTVLYTTHTYSVASYYNVCLVVTDANGCSNQYCVNDSLYRNSSTNNVIYINVLNNSTGISQISGLNTNISIYPNPNNGTFVIESSSVTKQTIQVYDVNGKIVLSQPINGKTNIDASILNEGVYNISIVSNGCVVNKRIVIVH